MSVPPSPPSTPPPQDNPYVGPRPHRRWDKLYGRDGEASDVIDLLLAERILLLHSPSGAGKTSLLQAKVMPMLDKRGFAVSKPMRVNAIPTNGFELNNRYVWSAIVTFLGEDVAIQPEFATTTFADFLDTQDRGPDGDRNRVLVFDQFEEILALAPGDRVHQNEFFRDVGRALRNTGRWAVFSMREDFMGGLAPFVVNIPTHLRVQYRIDFLDHEQAMQAAQGPTLRRKVTFEDDAANALVSDLAKIKEQLPGQQRARMVPGPYVEPVQLQVVCRELWEQLTEEWGDTLRTITIKNVSDFGDFDQALGTYYANSVRKVADATGASERAIRDWFEERLVTEEGLRNQTRAGPDVGDADLGRVLSCLTDEYLIRSDQRGASKWYELAHDRLIDPLLANNHEWRRTALDQ